MPDVLIRNFSAADLELLDKQARRLGLSRSEFLRRQLHQEARRVATPVTTIDLVRFSELVPDLEDEAVMTDAWS